jgi:DNA-binding NarL/FixJ family response regulator
MAERPIRVLIADDHPVFRFGLRTLLESQEDMVVVGEAESAEQAVRMAHTLQPDVILMDVNMPGLNGIEGSTADHGQHAGRGNPDHHHV